MVVSHPVGEGKGAQILCKNNVLLGTEPHPSPPAIRFLICKQQKPIQTHSLDIFLQLYSWIIQENGKCASKIQDRVVGQDRHTPFHDREA